MIKTLLSGANLIQTHLCPETFACKSLSSFFPLYIPKSPWSLAEIIIFKSCFFQAQIQAEQLGWQDATYSNHLWDIQLSQLTNATRIRRTWETYYEVYYKEDYRHQLTSWKRCPNINSSRKRLKMYERTDTSSSKPQFTNRNGRLLNQTYSVLDQHPWPEAKRGHADASAFTRAKAKKPRCEVHKTLRRLAESCCGTGCGRNGFSLNI